MSLQREDSGVTELEQRVTAQNDILELEPTQPPPEGTVTEMMDTSDILEAMTVSRPQLDKQDSDESSGGAIKDSPPPPDPEKLTTVSAVPGFAETILPKRIQGKTLPDVFIQHRRSFKRVGRDKFQNMMTRTYEKPVPQPEGNLAFTLQSTFHNVSLILQGFLSGLTTAHAVFVCNFADMDLLIKGYRWMALPAHVVFYGCFVLGAITAFDRLASASHGWSDLLNSFRIKNGGLPLLLWLIGTGASALTIRFDEALAPSEYDRQSQLPSDALIWWRILSTLRAACAVFCWLLMAMQPDANYLRDRIHTFDLKEDQRPTDD
ncbi:unnamed protein product, partial [Mesorhabditis spiculigera]